MGKAFLEKYDKRKKSRKWKTNLIIIVLIVSVVFTTFRFVNPLDISGLTTELSPNPEGIAELAVNFVLDRGITGILSFIIPVIVFFLGWSKKIKGGKRGLMTGTSVCTLSVMAYYSFVSIVPGVIEIILFMSYQASTLLGAIVFSRAYKYV